MHSQGQLDEDRHHRAHYQRGRARHGLHPIDLIVVDDIDRSEIHETKEVIGATGGRRKIWADWTPLQSDLRARAYACTLPRPGDTLVALSKRPGQHDCRIGPALLS
jgi:hypothetical protein